MVVQDVVSMIPGWLRWTLALAAVAGAALWGVRRLLDRVLGRTGGG